MIKTHRQTLMDQAIAERKMLRDWLLPHMANGKSKAYTKDQYRQLATVDLGTFSKAAFDHAWIAAIQDSPRLMNALFSQHLVNVGHNPFNLLFDVSQKHQYFRVLEIFFIRC
jgi:hypothetical protein